MLEAMVQWAFYSLRPENFSFWCSIFIKFLFLFICLFDTWNNNFIIRRVHISEKTLSFLNGEFEVEPAYGEKREEALRIAGLKTYFITKVIKPVRKSFFYGLI
jgi:hypothetical protein